MDDIIDRNYEDPRMRATAPSYIYDNSHGSPTRKSDVKDDGVPNDERKNTRALSPTSKSSSIAKDDTYEGDPYDLVDRFIVPQSEVFAVALAEIRSGQKRSCWLWFVLPTAPYIVDGQERGSMMNRHFALRTDEQAKAYLQAPTTRGVNLRRNYIEMLQAIEHQIRIKRRTLDELLGVLDSVKAMSSFHLFARIAAEMEDLEVVNLCDRVLEVVKSTKIPVRS